MDYKKTDAPDSTVTRDLLDLSADVGNVYETLAILSKRSNQIAQDLKEELTSKLAEFASSTDNLEEIFENREQIEISKFYERLAKPTAIAIEELENQKVYYRLPEETEDQ